MSLSTSDVIHMIIGLASIAGMFWINRHLYAGGWKGAGVTAIEAVYYLCALVGMVLGWYFNLQYMTTYANEVGWVHWTKLLFVNPASASGGQDLIIANLIIMPLWTISEGRRCGMKASWWYFPMSLVTSFAFGIAMFLAIQQRHLRWQAAQRSA